MKHLKTNLGLTFCLTMIFWTSVCFAEEIPNMVGTWHISSEAGFLLKGAAPSEKSHHNAEFSTLNAEAVVTQQKGRVLHGIFTSPKASEKFVAVIGKDNKSFYFVDEDGMLEGTFTSKDSIDVFYSQVTASDAVIAVGTWTRKK